jgi:hypothetical protein
MAQWYCAGLEKQKLFKKKFSAGFQKLKLEKAYFQANQFPYGYLGSIPSLGV